MTYATLQPMLDDVVGPRVRIRPFRLDDARALKRAIDESRDHVSPYLPTLADLFTLDDVEDAIIRWQSRYLLRADADFGVWRRDTDDLLGALYLTPQSWEQRSFEIGYWLRPSACGHGYMTEAVRLVCDYAVSVLKATRIEIRSDKRNHRSAALAQRLGFHLDAELRNYGRDADGNLYTMQVFSLVQNVA